MLYHSLVREYVYARASVRVLGRYHEIACGSGFRVQGLNDWALPRNTPFSEIAQ